MSNFAVFRRKHELQFPEGILNRHYEKLVQCDPRLKALCTGTPTRVSASYMQGTGLSEASQRPSDELRGLRSHGPRLFPVAQHPSSQVSPIDRKLADCHVLASNHDCEMRFASAHCNDLTFRGSGTPSECLVYLQSDFALLYLAACSCCDHELTTHSIACSDRWMACWVLS